MRRDERPVKGPLNGTRVRGKLKKRSWKQLWRGDALESKGLASPPRVWPRLTHIIWWGLWFRVITFMLGVRSTKWVFKGESCQANVYLITALSEKHFLRCNWCVLPLLWQHEIGLILCIEFRNIFNDVVLQIVLLFKSTSRRSMLHVGIPSASKFLSGNPLTKWSFKEGLGLCHE